MDVVDRYGLTVAELTTEEALDVTGPWRGPAVDLLRVVDPHPDDRTALTAAGFAVKPSWVNWVAPLRDSEAAFLGALGANERRKVRRGLDLAASSGLSVRVRPELEEGPLEEFLGVYEAQVAGMRNGLNLARAEQRTLLERSGSHIGVYAYEGGRMVGGCICWVRAEDSLLQLRYVATAAVDQRGALTRAVYMAAFQAGRELGCARMSLGNDTSLYGHVTSPGLYGFKKRLGFTPLPSGTVDPGAGGDEADRFVSLRALTDPSLLLAHDTGSGTDDSRGLRLHVLASRDDVDVAPYRADFLSGVTVTVIPEASPS
ncbi:GNAT family N-acetyltransferase [Streptomyces sp. WAC 01529]|uniref:GNAT family N-acetyltransferase n=1 Tax=Streptomyces sp. WAC 01529 TaxID=2203205 RepID=UPI000F6DC9AB|nr:GNAT family N-acetyltransferase [Streptomyces sp. WAC 01529]AZM56971.1 GNAT family N-acetyltransferase [Streptomyces sp. WAC 01529]